MTRLFLFIFIICSSLSIAAQHSIVFELDDVGDQDVIIAHYFGDKQPVIDTVKAKGGAFMIEGEDNLDPGLYLAVFPPKNNFIQFVVSKEDQEFFIKTSLNDPVSNPEIRASKENSIFFDYINFLGGQSKKAQGINAKMQADSSNTKQYEEQLLAIDKAVQKKQKSIIKKYPKSFTSMLILSERGTEIPEGLDQQARYDFYRSHYWDFVDFNQPMAINSPVFKPKLDYYFEKVVPQQPDSIIVAVDQFLNQAKNDESTLRYCLAHLLNTYSRSKIVGMDAVYVHLVDTYYAIGMAPWVKEESLAKIKRDAGLLRPILIGKTAPNVEMQTPEGKKIKLHDVDAEFTVFYIWDPECGHCKKSSPKMKAFYEEYKSKGVTIFSICGRTYEKGEECWKFVEEYDMGSYMNVWDPYFKSKYKKLYNVRSTPVIFLLDKNKTIISKRIGADQLGDIIDYHIDKKNK